MKKIIYASLLLLTSSLLVACTSHKNDLGYFNDLLQSQEGILHTDSFNIRIEPENELIIIVKSDVPQASAQFNLPYANPALEGTTTLSTNPTLQTYRVDQRGDIDFPVLGTIHVEGMTQMQLKEYLTKRISEYVKNPVVTVKLTEYRVTVLGEAGGGRVLHPQSERFSILDAIAECGGLSDFAVRDNIILMRRTADGNYEYHKMNVLDSNITRSPYFWLKNNDVILVQPNKIKQDNSKYNSNNGYKLTVISTVVSAASVIASLVIALSVK